MRTKPTGPLVSPMKTNLTPAQAAKMSEWTREDLAAGKITQTQADAIFNDLSTPAGQRAPDTRSAEERQFDAAFPVAQEKDFTIRYYTPGQEPPVVPPEVKAFDANARGWLGGAGFPRDLGNSLVNAITKTLTHTRAMTADQLEQYGHKEFEKLQKAHGKKLDERLRDTARMLDDLERKTPGLKQLLKSRGIGDNAMVANMLIAHAQIYHARRGRSGAAG